MENKQKKTEIRAYFSVFPEHIGPEKLTELIGLEPTNTHLKGDLLVKDNPKSYKHKENLWEIKSQLDSSCDLEDHVMNILDQLRPYKTKIINATKNMDKELAFTIFFSAERPSMHFNKNIVKQLAEYEVEIDLDVYFPELRS